LAIKDVDYIVKDGTVHLVNKVNPGITRP